MEMPQIGAPKTFGFVKHPLHCLLSFDRKEVTPFMRL